MSITSLSKNAGIVNEAMFVTVPTIKATAAHILEITATYGQPEAGTLFKETDTGRDLEWDGVGLIDLTAIATKETDPYQKSHFGTGGKIVSTSAAGVILTLGDMQIYGIPYSSIIFTKTGANGAMTIVWSVNSSGVLAFDVAMNAADSLNITGKNAVGDTFSNNILYIKGDGTVANVAITGAATFQGQIFRR